MTSLMATTIFVVSVFFILSDFSDELSFDGATKGALANIKTKRRWGIAMKCFAGAYIFIATILVMKTQRDRSRELQQGIRQFMKENTSKLNFYASYTKYRMTTYLPLWATETEAAGPVDFANMLTANDLWTL